MASKHRWKKNFARFDGGVPSIISCGVETSLKSPAWETSLFEATLRLSLTRLRLLTSSLSLSESVFSLYEVLGLEAPLKDNFYEQSYRFEKVKCQINVTKGRYIRRTTFLVFRMNHSSRLSKQKCS